MAARSNRSSLLVWRKASGSAPDDDCVEVAKVGRSVLIRDSKDPEGAVLSCTATEWARLVETVRTWREA